MNIKNIVFSLIVITNILNMHAMQLPPADATEEFADEKIIPLLPLADTQQFDNYRRAQKLHKTHNTKETFELLDEAENQLIKTEEAQLILKQRRMEKTPAWIQYKAAEINHKKHNTADTLCILKFCESELHNTREYQEWSKLQTKKQTIGSKEVYSDNVINKHRMMEQTPEYMQYEQAKEYQKTYNTPDAQDLVDACRTELYTTKECQEWLHAIDQEKHVTNNILKSERRHNTQQKTYNFSGISEAEINAKIIYAEKIKKRSIDAFNAVQNTLEFQHYLEANAQYEKDKSLLHPMNLKQSINLINLKESKRSLEKTQEVLEYCKIQAEARLLLAMERGCVPIIIEENYSPCLAAVGYIEQEKMMRKLEEKYNIDFLRIQENRKGSTHVFQ
jgi:hypothetical protein